MNNSQSMVNEFTAETIVKLQELASMTGNQPHYAYNRLAGDRVLEIHCASETAMNKFIDELVHKHISIVIAVKGLTLTIRYKFLNSH